MSKVSGNKAAQSKAPVMVMKEVIHGDDARNIQRIRAIALRVSNLREMYFNPQSRLLSFQLVDSGWRINVYYTTGTVGTCLEHPHSGKTQMFRRDVDYAMLEDIFRNPRVHTGKGYYETSTIGQKRHASEVSGAQDDEETVLRNHLATLMPQVEMVQARLREIEEEKAQEALQRARAERQQREAAESVRLAEQRRLQAIRVAEEEEARAAAERERAESERREREQAALRQAKSNRDRLINARGTRHDYALSYSTHFPESMTDTRCVAIGEGGYVAVSDAGSCSYHGIPSNVAEVLKRQHLRNLDYIAIGPASEYFIRKTNGKVLYSGSTEFESCMETGAHGVKFIAFAEDGAFFIKYDDGSTQFSYNFDDIVPPEVFDIVTSSPCIAHFWFGEKPYWSSCYDTPYCITYNAGSVKYDNLPNNLQNWLQNEYKHGNKIKQVLACSNDNFFVRYS